MQVTERPEANYRERQRKTTGESRGWGLGQRIGTYCTSEKKKIKSKSPVLSSPVSLILLLSGLVEEDVSRLRVFWDVWGKPVKLLDRLGIDFLHDTWKSLITDQQMYKQMSQGTLSRPSQAETESDAPPQCHHQTAARSHDSSLWWCNDLCLDHWGHRGKQWLYRTDVVISNLSLIFSHM